jgi:hypothetical protein
MKIAVNPYRRVLPRVSRDGLLPGTSHAGGDVTGGDHGEPLVEVVPKHFQGNAAVRIGRCLAG